MRELVAPWFVNYVNVDKNELFDLFRAADFLKMESLLQLIASKIACELKNKSTEEKRDYLNIQLDLQPEEIEQINEENKRIRNMLED